MKFLVKQVEAGVSAVQSGAWALVVLGGMGALSAGAQVSNSGTTGTGTQAPAGSSSAAAAQAAGQGTSQGTANRPLNAKLGPAASVTYDNKYELYGGLNLMTFQAGQNLPKRMNLGGVEVLGTYWLTKKIGLGAEFRGEAGTTPVSPNPYFINRPVVYLMMGLGGVQYRGPKNQYAALSYHAYGGVASGTFDSGTQGGTTGTTGSATSNAKAVGLYPNGTAPIGAFGASVDFNRSKRLAFRISPDLMVEKFGTEVREFFAMSGGVVYRFGKK